MNKVELLAPAGDSDSLHAAVESGADAVYLGGTLFNARQSAGNFNMEQLKAAIDYAHIRGVNIYLTMNTLVADNEIEEALSFAGDAFLIGIDSIIVQDIGLAGLLRKTLPELPLHGSTQMTIYDTAGAKQLEKFGFRRVVLAREVPAEEIRNIVKSTSLEVEMFVHGALCICYSGQCLMSSIIGGRSGNRGKCAQPCRLPYELLQEGGQNSSRSSEKGIPQYLLSPKDLCLLDNLNKIVDMGVKSLKIEGRMKSPEYVAAVTGTYRKYIDRMSVNAETIGQKDKCIIEAQDMHELMQVFNRGGFSDGYFHGKNGRDMMCFEKPKNWGIYLGKILSYNASVGTFTIKLDEELSLGDGVEIWNGDNESPGTVVSLLRLNGGNTSSAAAGSIVEVGFVRGRIEKDCTVYKTSDKSLNAKLADSWNGKLHRKIVLDCKVIAKNGRPIKLEVSDRNGNTVEAEGTILPQKALNKALTRERLEEQLRKTGNTPFVFDRFEFELDEGLAIPVSEINEVRRKVLDNIEHMRIAKVIEGRDGKAVDTTLEMALENISFTGRDRHNNSAMSSKEQQRIGAEKGAISLLFYRWDKTFDYCSYGADRIYLPLGCILEPTGEAIIKACKAAGQEVFIHLQPITRGAGLDLILKAVDRAVTWGIDGFLAGNPGTIHMLKERTELKIFGDLGLNIYNGFSAGEAESFGLDGVTLSAELTLEQISSMKKKTSMIFEAAVYGRLPVMISEYCPVGACVGGHDSKKNCNRGCNRGDYRLRDRKGIDFPVLCDNLNCRSMILNSNVLFLPDSLQRLAKSGVESFRLYIWDEGPELIKSLVGLHQEAVNNPSSALIKYAGLINKIKAGGFTKGHYFRGV